MKFARQMALVAAAAISLSAAAAQAATINLKFDFTGGFDLSVDGGAEVASGQIVFDVLVQDDATDLLASGTRGRFTADSITVTAADLGIFGETIISPDPIFVDTFSGGLTIIGNAFNPDIGWNGGPGPDTFMSDVNDLSTLPLPTSVTMLSTFFLDEITLSNGATLTGNTGNDGPNGTFSATAVAAVPLPATLPLMVFALGGLGFAARRRKAA